MPRASRAFAAACLLLAVAGEPVAHAAARVIEGRGVWAYDGDTVALVDRHGTRHRIRLAAVDAPEKGRPWSALSRKHLDALVREVPARAHCRAPDRYGRPVCIVMVPPPDCRRCAPALDVGLAQIEAGYARWYRRYADEQAPQVRLRYARAEAMARDAGRGLWRPRRGG